MDLMLRLLPESGVPLYHQVVAHIKEAILAGRLAPGMRLPSGRELAAAHGIARNTATMAYQQLVSEGYLEGRERSGHYVSLELPQAEILAMRGAAPEAQDPHPRRLSQWAQVTSDLPLPDTQTAPPPFDFRQRFPARDAFPAEEWRRHYLDALTSAPDLLEYASPEGYGPLREAVAVYASRSRGCTCDPSQVIITSGARQAIHLLALTLINPGDAVALEEPGYAGARQTVAAYGARVIPVPVDQHGIQVELLDGHPALRLVYVTPSHQHPTGVTLDLSRRLRLVDWARRTGALIVEDDYDGDFRYEGRPLQALQGLDGGRSVAYMGTFAKSLAPGLRLGYLIVPEDLVTPVARAKWLIDRQTPGLPQAALAAFIAGGGFERHLRRARILFRHRRDAFLAALRRHLPGTVPGPATAGMHVMVTMPQITTAADEAALIQQAAEAGVGLQSARPAYAGAAPPGQFLFWFSHMTPAQIDEGLRRLATASRLQAFC